MSRGTVMQPGPGGPAGGISVGGGGGREPDLGPAAGTSPAARRPVSDFLPDLLPEGGGASLSSDLSGAAAASAEQRAAPGASRLPPEGAGHQQLPEREQDPRQQEADMTEELEQQPQ